ncbi:unnamed protein product [Choristocarpus tenellus]
MCETVVDTSINKEVTFIPLPTYSLPCGEITFGEYMASPEVSAAYLQRSNFKTLMEWLTARCILHRPEDPMVFCRDLLTEKIEMNGGNGAAYDPSSISKYLKECYDDAMNVADEHGIIGEVKQGKQKPPNVPYHCGNNGGSEGAEQEVGAETIAPASAVGQVRMEGTGTGAGNQHRDLIVVDDPLVAVLQGMCELGRPELCATAIITGASKVFNARRAALFKVVGTSNYLLEMGVDSEVRRLVEAGKGLVGRAGAGSSAVALEDPSSAPDFLATMDLPRRIGSDCNQDLDGLHMYDWINLQGLSRQAQAPPGTAQLFVRMLAYKSHFLGSRPDGPPMEMVYQ